MLRRLRRQLTALSAALTGAVLVVMALAALSLAEGQLRRGAEATFSSNINSIVVKLQSDRVVSATWLAQMESSERLIVSVRDKGTPLTFRGAWTPATGRQTLLDRVEKMGRDLGVDASRAPISVIDTTSVVFEVRGDHGDAYLGAVTQVPVTGGWQSLVLLRDLSGTQRQVWLLRGAFAALVLLGVAALVGLCWLFAGRAIRPVEDSRRRQAEFVAAASHELRSPLAVIRTSVSAMDLDPAQAPRLRRSIEGECARMARLVDDLLSLARSDAGTWSLHTAPVDVDALLLETAEQFIPLAQQRGQHLELEVPDTDLPPVSGDAQRLGQILTILLDNAFRYTPVGGTVTLSAHADTKWLTLEVRDPGPGIAPGDVDRVFDRFYRADASRSTKEHFGLGLSIAKELVKAHRGTIRVAKTGKTGTTFEIKLPLMQ